ncbi:uncharacterized protein EV154DRAFT_581652, partial [Mucor mucedo]|uniref:uncharacterized protein n=1 Tax=Mucor mucedo TaxID=29922 RepID=UPI00221E3947
MTNDMSKISPGGHGFYAAFLTPPGRMLFDTFIYPVNVGENFPHPKYMIDCPSDTKTLFMRHIKRYLLRSKIKMRDCSDEYGLWHMWGPALKGEGDPELIQKGQGYTDIGCTDPRIPGFGYRAVVKKDTDIQHIFPKSVLTVVKKKCIVDFRKGCYVGQELTIRTYHTGVVRKRLVPVQIYHKDDPVPTVQSVNRNQTLPSVLLPQTDIKLVQGVSKRGVGKMASGVHNIGLALMRLEHVQNSLVDNDVAFTVPEDDSLRIKPFLPEWWAQER